MFTHLFVVGNLKILELFKFKLQLLHQGLGLGHLVVHLLAEDFTVIVGA